ncbi:MAG: trypsin-like peptidase domain-containing protein, partial [Planctomycetaceae bacterium]|nr:trypsin-like peptidase domain-containing protein [Planctomycetaceae bacterium]
FHINPGWQLLEIPQYGNIDFLITCNLRNGVPRVRQYIPKAGANGSGIRLSPDGKRITYLSFGGFPPLSKNLPAWNPANLKTEPVIYDTKDRAVTNLLAYHPTLNLVAVPGGNSAVLFDRETGREINDKLLFTKDGLGEAKVDDLFFSPDGTSLVFLCNEKLKGRYLRSIPLKLTSQEKSKISQGVKRVAHQPLVAQSKVAVKKAEIQSLNSAPREKKLSAQEIASQFNQSVLLIKTDEGSASGFVVGLKGYILTCAHAIPSEGKIRIAYSSEKTGSQTKREAEAELVHIDEDLDLALLKMKGNLSLKPVALDERESVESGEQVTVIGNPSVGETILSQTLTTGVVSNPKRMLREQTLIQISAAVNPGNSGGPVFDEFGNVIGLVVLKADIEATGFAVSVTHLRSFLQSVIKN